MSTDEQDRKMLQEVHAAIVGNPSMGHVGLVDRMKKVEDDVADHKKKFVIFIGIFTGVSLAFGWLKAKILAIAG